MVAITKCMHHHVRRCTLCQYEGYPMSFLSWHKSHRIKNPMSRCPQVWYFANPVRLAVERTSQHEYFFFFKPPWKHSGVNKNHVVVQTLDTDTGTGQEGWMGAWSLGWFSQTSSWVIDKLSDIHMGPLFSNQPKTWAKVVWKWGGGSLGQGFIYINMTGEVSDKKNAWQYERTSWVFF